MKKSIFDKVVLNNGYEVPQYWMGPAMPVSDDNPQTDTNVKGTSNAFRSSDGSTQASFEEIMQAAINSGLRAFDSGARYGTEAAIGSFFRSCGLKREELFVSTKVNNKMHGYDNTMRDFENSMNTLALDYVDVYFIHCPVPVKGLYCDTWKALEQINRSGRAKAIAVSNFNVQHFYDLAEISDVVPALNQIEQHPFYVQPNLLAYMKKNNIVSMSYSPLGQGKFAKEPRLRWMAEKHGKTVAQVILRWHLQTGFVPVTRSSSLKRLKENTGLYDFELSKEDMAYLSTLNHLDRVWHIPDRFPGTAAHVSAEKKLRDTFQTRVENSDLTKDVKASLYEKLDAVLSECDIDFTKDYIIWCFKRAEAKYGANANIEQQACIEAELVAGELFERFSK